MTPSDFDNQRKRWLKNNEYNEKNTVNAIITKKGDLKEIDSGYCHSPFRASSHEYPFVYALTRVNPGVVKEEDALLFLDYWMNESPFNICFPEKDPEKALSHGLIVSTLCNPVVLGGALIGSRLCYENYFDSVKIRMKTFSFLKKEGHSGNQAFIGAHLYSIDSDNKFKLSFLDVAHSIFAEGISKTKFTNFVSGEFDPKAVQNPISTEHNHGYKTGVMDLFGPTTLNWASFIKDLRNITPKKYKNSRSLNIFEVKTEKSFLKEDFSEYYEDVINEVIHGQA